MPSRRPSKREILESFSLGSWITIPHPSVAEVLGRTGFDWLTVDLEHSPITLETAAEMIRVTDLMGLRAFVRVGSHDANVIKRVMDAGAHGIIASTVNTPQQAAAIVSSVKYPPKGTRGVGLSRAQGYAEEFDIHYRWLNEESLVIVQIEHIDAVRNLEPILAVPGVDGFFIGPYDLSASLGVPGQFQHPKMLEAIAEVDRVRKKVQTLAGIHVVQTHPDEVRKRLDEGYRFIAYGLDFLFLANKAREGLKIIRESAKPQ
ncbi:MAG: 2,4-dihydroxyhept-2-ene-1,7-dioic acid aldolase [Fimbriimonadaceae bacterium]|nr:2,4-dihydroxyhept-2-ene-1,7-dioic acid aldolase [Fimbriimonadaceae bacterium]